MAATFDPSLATPKDRIRQRLGDTDTASALIQDETIAAILAIPTGETATAARLARDLSAKFSRDVDFTVDGQGQRNAQRAEAFRLLANDLAREAALETPPTSSGGIATGGIIVTGATSDEVWDARCDPDRAANTPFGFRYG